MKQYLRACLKFSSIIKPGIVYGNLIPVFAGFFLASGPHITLQVIWIILGTAITVSSGCVLNNYIDRDIDALMYRTKNRLLPNGDISPIVALILGLLLGIVGIAILYFMVNTISAILGLLGLFVYVVLYTMILKRNSVYAVHVGSISGAIPPVIGYCGSSNNIDINAILLFITFAVWQMPHSFAIAIFRAKDYASVKIPTLLYKKGIGWVKISILCYVILFTISNASIYIFGTAGIVHLINSLMLGVYWIYLSMKGFKAKDDIKWARKIFFASIIVMILMSITIAFS